MMHFISGFLAGAALSAMNILWWRKLVAGWARAKPSNVNVLFRLAIKFILLGGIIYFVVVGRLSAAGFCIGVAFPLIIYAVLSANCLHSAQRLTLNTQRSTHNA